MRIAQVAPLYESVPPRLYGGTERIVAYLTEELVRQNHEVTLFASGDSTTSARLVPCCGSALRLDSSCVDPIPHHLIMLEQVFQRADQFDVIHFHTDYFHFPLSRRSTACTVTTLHGRLDIPDLVPLYREYAEMPVISISDAQRTPLPWINWQATVYHGLPDDLLCYREETQGDYLVFLGRISPEKGVDTAIDIAKRSGIKLKIAAKVDKVDQEYFQEKIAALLDHPLVEYLGEVNEGQKQQLLGQALALLFPINWEEPFGLVMIESMSCGTPIIAFPRGSVPEVMANGVSGYVVRNVDEAVAAAGKARELDRKRCRQYFEERFIARRMASDYVMVYEKAIVDKRLRSNRTAFSTGRTQ